MSYPIHHCNTRRRGVTVVLVAVFLVVLLAMVAFAVDIGQLSLARTQLQAAADSAALAAAATTNQSRSETETVAKKFAAYHTVAGRPAQLNSNDIEYGTWDTNTRVFTPSAQAGNAVRVTVRTDPSNGGGTHLFFGSLLNLASVNQGASAVATCNPRDIAFVVDLSGSMNDDTDPDGAAALNSQYAPQGYPTIGTDIMQQVYSDFNFGTYPGITQWMGQSIGVTSGGDPLTKLSSTTGPLSNATIPSQYRIKSSDSTSTRQKKAYSWAMDVQIPQVMPNAKPVPNSTNATSYNYWQAYLSTYKSEIGYSTYMQFMMDNGRDGKPGNASFTPLSLASGICPMHSEATAGGTFSFPPREQPTHASRRALIAALQVIKERNQTISDVNQRDWVSIITFDKVSNGPVLPLTSNYDAAMAACTQFQAVSDNSYSTATENGLISAYNHIKPQSLGGQGRNTTNKIVVLLTDGMPNLYQSSTGTIDNYVANNPSANFYGTGTYYPQQASLMQTAKMQGNHWYVYPVGIGLGTDYDFMDRMARMGLTANISGQSARGSGNPGDYEVRLTAIFRNIITNPKLRLVK